MIIFFLKNINIFNVSFLSKKAEFTFFKFTNILLNKKC